MRFSASGFFIICLALGCATPKNKTTTLHCIPKDGKSICFEEICEDNACAFTGDSSIREQALRDAAEKRRQVEALCKRGDARSCAHLYFGTRKTDFSAPPFQVSAEGQEVMKKICSRSKIVCRKTVFENAEAIPLNFDPSGKAKRNEEILKRIHQVESSGTKIEWQPLFGENTTPVKLTGSFPTDEVYWAASASNISDGKTSIAIAQILRRQ